MNDQSPVIGITEHRLASIIEEATRRGYEAGRREFEESDLLTSRAAIIAFLSDGKAKPMSASTFNRKRASGEFGNAVVGQGRNCKARKTELMQAIQRHQMSLM